MRLYRKIQKASSFGIISIYYHFLFLIAKNIAIITTDIIKVLIGRFSADMLSLNGHSIFNRYNVTELISQQEIKPIKIRIFFI